MAHVGDTPRTELDRAWLQDFAGRWEQAWNSHDPGRLLALMTDDVVYDDSAWPVTMRGQGAVREFLDFTWRAFPDLHFEMTDGLYVAAGEPKAAFHWRATGTHEGPVDPPGFAATGKRVTFDGADLHEYRDGRVSRLRVIFDMMDLGRQIGTVPRHGSPLEKAGAAAQRVAVRARERLRG